MKNLESKKTGKRSTCESRSIPKKLIPFSTKKPRGIPFGISASNDLVNSPPQNGMSQKRPFGV